MSDYFTSLEFRLNSLKANTRRKETLSDVDLNQACAIYSDAHRAGRDDVRIAVRALLDSFDHVYRDKLR